MPKKLPVRTLRHLFYNSISLYGHRAALTQLGDASWTYREVGEAVESLSHWLEEQGVVFGDSVAILGENCPQWGIAYLAVTTMGAVAVPILTEFHADAIAHIIRHSEAKVVFVSEKLYPKVESAVFDPAPLFVTLESYTPIEQGLGLDRLRELKAAGLRELRKLKGRALRLASMAQQEPGEDDLAALIYTSGTTGHSKGVMLTHSNIVSNVIQTLSFVPLDKEDRMLSMLPMAHTFECTLGFVTPFSTGLEVFYLDKPPTARVLLPALAEVKPTVLIAVPLIMEKIYKNSVLPKLTSNWLLRRLYAWAPTRKLLHRKAGKKLKALFGGAVKVIAIGGAPIPGATEQFMHEGEFPYTVGYGLTETSPLVTGTMPDKARLKSSGTVVQGVEVRIVDAKPETGEGEIQVRGANVMKGYYKDPENTAAAFDNGWFKTGDLGSLDDNGYLYVRGRSKNMFLGASGENIYPEEIESVLTAIPLVAEALVYQTEGLLVGKVFLDATLVDALLEGISGQEAVEKRQELFDSIRSEVNGKVSSFARLNKVVEQVEPFEKTPTHKIKRYLYVDTQ